MTRADSLMARNQSSASCQRPDVRLRQTALTSSAEADAHAAGTVPQIDRGALFEGSSSASSGAWVRKGVYQLGCNHCSRISSSVDPSSCSRARNERLAMN